MIHARAFTIIELLVYTALFSLFMLCVGGFFHSMYFSVRFQNGKVMQQVQNALAIDMIRRDLMSASTSPEDWDEQAFVCRKCTLMASNKPETVCVGWRMNKNRLQRIEGTYDFAKRVWLKKTGSYFKCSITALTCMVVSNQHQQVTHAVLTVDDGRKKPVAAQQLTAQQHYIRLRNRVLV